MIQFLLARRELLKKNKENGEGGFTLIELLIVIIVLGILAAIVVFAVGSTRKDSVSASCRTNFKAAELSAEAVNTRLGSYPAAQAGIVAPSAGALLKSWPTSSDYTLTYAQTGSGTGYTITVAGSGLVGGTSDAGCAQAP